ncbi:MAG: cob(I)yrinic acid a,c-diamide adenosyltransferase [Bacteroidales bacterium]
MKKMRVYTKTGDRGQTSLASGTRVRKDHPRLEAYGTIDELNSFLGLVESIIIDESEKSRIRAIQNRVFVISSTLAIDDPQFLPNLPIILEDDVLDLERAMDQMLDQISPLQNFIIPGGSPAIAYCHIARTVCRRAERLMIHLSDEVEIEPIQIKYVNRLSDYLFVLARKTAHDSGVEEIIWTAGFRDMEKNAANGSVENP